MTENTVDQNTLSKGTKRKVAEDEWKDFGHYMSKKQEKLWAQFEQGKSFEQKKSDIFAGVCIFVNGYTEPPTDELCRLMQQHGGEYHVYECSRTTHTIASNLCYTKLVQVRPTDMIVKPEWITDSIAAGRQLPEDDYRLVKNKDKGSMLKFLSSNADSRKNDDDQEPETMEISDDDVEETAQEPEQVRENTGIQAGNEMPTATTDPGALIEAGDQPSTSSKKSAPGSTKTGKAGDPNFLKDYYSRSRLHFISTWAQEMKSFVNQLKADADSSSFVGLEKLMDFVKEKRANGAVTGLPSSPCASLSDGEDANVFMHLDMDCFFVSVGLRKRPDLRGQPVAVAHSSGVRGKSTSTTAEVIEESGNERFSSCSDVASCSYEARACGVKNGMWLGKAKDLCPNLRIIPYDFEEYHAVSQKLYTIVASYTLQIEPVSCDEVFVDITSLCKDTGASPLDVATVIRRDIFDQCQCPSSAGLGPNMLVARLATKRAKPNGQYHVTADEVSDFMAGQKVADIPGVGREGKKKFAALNVETCEQLWSVPISSLRHQFGAKTADQLYNFSKGIDSRKVKGEVVRKSVSCDMNYGIRFTEKKEVHKFLTDFAGEVVNRLRRNGVKGRTVILKLQIRSPDAPIEPPKFLGTGMCDTVSRSTTLLTATDDVNTIAKECITLFDEIDPVVPDLRGIGISMQKLESTSPGNAAPETGAGSILQFVKAGGGNVKAVMAGKSLEVESTEAEKDQDTPVSPSRALTIPKSASSSPSKKKPSACIDSTTVCAAETRTTSSEKPRASVGSSKAKPKKSGDPALFGETDHEEVRRLIMEWMAGEGPSTTDISMVSHYFSELTEALELSTVRSMLQSMHRFVTQRQNEQWLQAYEAIVNDVQDVMIERYGCPLRILRDEEAQKP